MYAFSASLLALALPQLTQASSCPYLQQRANAAAHMPPAHYARDDTAVEGGKNGVFLMNRIAPGTSKLYIADLDGSNERPLLSNPVFEYHPSFSPDGQWVFFTSERNGDGNSDIYRVRTNGSDLQPLVTTPAVEDSVVLSPNGSLAAYVSTEGMIANIWLLDLNTGHRWNLTDTPAVAATTNMSLPHGYFRPSWSPDGQWIAFSSDRNTEWLGHGEETFQGLSGWEHTQELAIYAIRPNGSDFHQVVKKDGYALGSPQWSPDGKRLVYYEMTRETTYNAHSSWDLASSNSSIVSVDFATGTDRVVEVAGSGVKIFPQAAPVKDYTTSGIYYNTSSEMIRSPAWSPDGKKVVYEKTAWNVRPQEKRLYSWDSEWEYRFTDVFPTLSAHGRLAMTSKQIGDSSILNMNATSGDRINAFDPVAAGIMSEAITAQGAGGAYQPSWSPDDEWLTFGVGYWFQGRAEKGGWVVRARSDGSYAENLTQSAMVLSNTTLNTGFPSFSHDGRKIVFRVWGTNSLKGDRSQLGLRLLDLDAPTNASRITVLTTEWDTLPSFSPDGERVVFTRKTGTTNYDVCTIRPDGTDLQVLTSSVANDAHAVWSDQGQIIYTTGEYGFQYECGLYDDTFQPYSIIQIMNADGSNKRPLTNSMWEDAMPTFIDNKWL